MSNGNGNNTRKRPLENNDNDSANKNNNDKKNGVVSVNGSVNNGNGKSNSRATQAQELKRRQIQQSSWGFREVLTECGLLEFASVVASSSSSSDEPDGKQHQPSATVEVGCQLESKVTPSSLRSSLHALLGEMSKNGIDPNNERVLKDMEDIILGGGEIDGEVGGGNSNSNRGGSSLRRRMLLPLYRVRTTQNLMDFTQFTQQLEDDDDDDDDEGNNNGAKAIVESSSLIKVLLRVDTLQSTLLTALMQKIPELASAEESDNEGAANDVNDRNNNDESDVPRLIFSNLRWLDHVVDYPQLANAFVECLTVLASTSSDCERTRGILLDAIATLPDVLNDGNAMLMLSSTTHTTGDDDDDDDDDDEGDEENNVDEEGLEDNPILSTLQQLRISDPTLLIPCLDALGSLPLTESQIEHVTRDALEALANVETWGLPALTTFLMNHCPSATSGSGKDMAREVVEELRKLPLGNNNTDGEDDAAGMDVDDNRDDKGSNNANNAAASSSLTIEALSRGFAHRPDLASQLFKSIKEASLTTGSHTTPADIWLLACCAVAPHNRPKVKAIFKSKASSGMFTSRLLRESLSGNGVALTSLFGTSLCDLADGLLRSATSSDASGKLGGACELGITLYCILFEEFNEPMQRQEIVGSLVTHVGSGVGMKCGGEVDAALKVFCSIVDKKKKSKDEEDGAAALRPFTPFLTSMLDHLHHMSTSQVRRLFLLLFAVGDEESGDSDLGAMASGGGKSMMMGESACDIVIRKHLSIASFAKKRIGIIGTIAYAVSRSSQLQDQQSIIDDENAMAETEATCLPGNAAVASSPIVKEIKDMIEFAYEKCKPSGGAGGLSLGSNNSNNYYPSNSKNVTSRNLSMGGSAFSEGSSMAFMLDELCHAVRGGRLALLIREWLDELFQHEFENWYVGDFEENEDEDAILTQRGTKGSAAGKGQADSTTMLDQNQIPTDSTDLTLLNGTCADPNAPPGELRYNISGADSVVYVKLLPLLLSSSNSAGSSIILPVQLCPMFRLMSTISDLRFGGKGLAEIDAMLECPLLLPSEECSGMEFEELSPQKQWVATSSYFFGTCWVRQLINSFIYAAIESFSPGLGGCTPAAVGSFTSSSQGFNSDEVQKKIVARLEALVELEEELRFTCSKCFVFAPPGLDLLPAPRELYDDSDKYPNNSNNDAENIVNMNVDDPSKMSKEDKKALAVAKKQIAKRAKAKVQSKQKRLKVRQKHEERLVQRTLGALRKLDPMVCVALGFAELSVMGNGGGGTQASGRGIVASQGLSQQIQQVASCGGPVTTLLLKLLQKSLSDSLSEKKGMVFKARVEGNGNLEDDDVENGDNPYMLGQSTTDTANTTTTNTFAGIALASCEESSQKSFALLDKYLRGGVFASLYEHLAACAELRCGPNRDNDTETEKQLIETARCLFSCVESLMSSGLLTRSATGKMFLAAILKQIAEGDRDDYGGSDNGGNRRRQRRPTTGAMNKLLAYVMDNVNEIVTGAYTGDLEFAMDGVVCMLAIAECSKRISDASGSEVTRKGDDEDAPNFPFKLSEVADKLLRQNWPDDTKMNKGNVGKLLSLYVEHSPNRMETLSNLVNDVLSEVPHLGKGQGVAVFPTCSHATFGSYYSTSLEYLWKELVNLFNSSLGKTKDPALASNAMELMKEMIGLLQLLFNLTKEHDSLAKKAILLQQLKYGSRFIETFVLKAIPFFQTHFQSQNEEMILDNIRHLQKWSRQLYHIISHGKREKDANLAKEAPRAKKALEMFIHKVKALLKKNRCMTAMWTKTLKAKDIDGTSLRKENESKDEEEEEEEEGGEVDDDDSGEDDDDDDADTDEDEYDTDEED